MNEQDYFEEDADDDSYDPEDFQCPFCASFGMPIGLALTGQTDGSAAPYGLSILQCPRSKKCGKISIWEGYKVLYPPTGGHPFAERSMPKSVKKYYEEARRVATASPRAAAALLRLAIEELFRYFAGLERYRQCELLSEGVGTLKHNISQMSRHGHIDEENRKKLDFVKLTGDYGVHGMPIVFLEDNESTTHLLFRQVNKIVKKLIVEPQEEEAYERKVQSQQRAVNTAAKQAEQSSNLVEDVNNDNN